MRTRWFADPAEGERLDETLLRLVGDVSRMLDGLASPPVAAGTGRIDAAASAVVLPHTGVPGCSLVVQVAGWSASVGCWWSVGTDPRAGPANLELSAERPLRPDGLARAVAWLERELRRPVVTRARHYGLARRREWAVVLDDGYELPLRHRWLPGGGAVGEGGTARPGRLPGGGGVAEGGAARPGRLPGPRSWLLGLAVAAALARWAVGALSFQLLGLGVTWTGTAARALGVTAAGALVAWFWGAGARRPVRVRAPMLAGLLLATLAAGLALLVGPAEPPVPGDPGLRALALLLRELAPSLLGVAALACLLSAFLGLPGRAMPRAPWPRALPVAAGLAWGIDLAVGLGWLVRLEPVPGEEALVWHGAFLWILQGAAVGLAIVLAFVVLDRRPGLSRPAARAGLAGAVLLALAWSLTVQLATSWLVPLLPAALWSGLAVAPVVLAGFAGTALLAVAAAAPQTPSLAEGSPSASVAAASNRNPMARPNWGE
jgi:hypothetical protein